MGASPIRAIPRPSTRGRPLGGLAGYRADVPWFFPSFSACRRYASVYWATAPLLVGFLWLTVVDGFVNIAPDPGSGDTTPAVGDWLPAGGGLLVVALLTVSMRWRGAFITAATSAVTASITVSVLYGTVLPPRLLTSDTSPAEVLGMAVFCMVAARRLPVRQAVPVVIGCLGAVAIALPVRNQPTPSDADKNSAMTAVLLLLLVTSLATVVRLIAALRERRIENIRQSERLAIARDLHDTVAHQVTGIIVQAQAVRHVTGNNDDPSAELVARALEAIEEAGNEALRSMSRLVGALRGTSQDAPRSQGDLRAVLAQLVEREQEAGLPVKLRTDEALPPVPMEVATAVERIAQESLTNARRYARGATIVEVRVRTACDGLEVIVEDDGRSGHGPRVPLRGSGFGLVGMRERAELLGGLYDAGPRPAGGWSVWALLPLRSTDNHAEVRL